MNRRNTMRALVGAAFCGFVVARAESELLPASQAFQILEARREGVWITVALRIAPGYAIYSERTRFEVSSASVSVADIVRPAGVVKWDESLGERMTLIRGGVVFKVKISGAGKDVRMSVVTQGCADVGVCYPPVVRTFLLGSFN